MSGVSVPITYAASEGAITSVVAGVTAPGEASAVSTLTGKTATGAAVTFTPITVGTYNVMATVMDDRGSTTSAQTTVAISPSQLPGGSLTVSMTPSKQNPKPGEPVIYTVIVSNPTDRIMKDIVLKQAVPPQVILNAASAMLDGKAATITAGSGYFTLPLGDMAPKAQHTITVTTVLK